MDIKKSDISEQEKVDECEKITNPRKGAFGDNFRCSLLGAASERKALNCKRPCRTKSPCFAAEVNCRHFITCMFLYSY